LPQLDRSENVSSHGDEQTAQICPLSRTWRCGARSVVGVLAVVAHELRAALGLRDRRRDQVLSERLVRAPRRQIPELVAWADQLGNGDRI
jgi:hypothetical protein